MLLTPRFDQVKEPIKAIEIQQYDAKISLFWCLELTSLESYMVFCRNDRNVPEAEVDLCILNDR